MCHINNSRFNADGDGGTGGEEEDAGSQRAGETSGGGERTPAGAETGHTRLSASVSSFLCVPVRRC